jgi:hypothetical protein
MMKGSRVPNRFRNGVPCVTYVHHLDGGFLGMRRIFGPPVAWEPEKVGNGHVLYAVQRGSKTASKAAENSGQSPTNLLCTVYSISQIVGDLCKRIAAVGTNFRD